MQARAAELDCAAVDLEVACGNDVTRSFYEHLKAVMSCGVETRPLYISLIAPRSTNHLGDAAMSVESILSRKGTDVTTIAPEASLKRAADWLRLKNIGSLVVMGGEAVLGLISEREIVHAFSRFGEAAAAMPVKEIMRHGVITVSPDESINRVMSLMTRHRVRHMPVLRDGKLVGIISIGDVVSHRLEDLELETSVLRDAYIAAR